MPKEDLAQYIFQTRLAIWVREHIWMLMAFFFLARNWGDTLPALKKLLSLKIAKGSYANYPKNIFDEGYIYFKDHYEGLVSSETLELLSNSLANLIFALGLGLFAVYILDHYLDHQLIRERARRHHRRMVRNEFKNLEIERRLFVTLNEERAFREKLQMIAGRLEELLRRYEKNAHALNPHIELAPKLSDDEVKLVDLFSELREPPKNSEKTSKPKSPKRFIIPFKL